MKKNPETMVKKFTIVSRTIFLSIFLFAILSGANAWVISYLELKLKWLEIIRTLLFALGALMLVVSWITPGLLIILGVPNLAHAWLRGMNPILISNKSWEQLSNNEKLFIFFYAICISAFTLFAIIGLSLYAIRG